MLSKFDQPLVMVKDGVFIIALGVNIDLPVTGRNGEPRVNCTKSCIRRVVPLHRCAVFIPSCIDWPEHTTIRVFDLFAGNMCVAQPNLITIIDERRASKSEQQR